MNKLTNAIVPWNTIKPPFVEFNSRRSKEFADIAHAAEVAMAAVGITDPTYPLYSPTDSGPGMNARQSMLEGITNVVAGRDPLSNFDALMSDWRSKVGDKIRGEFQDQLQATR